MLFFVFFLILNCDNCTPKKTILINVHDSLIIFLLQKFRITNIISEIQSEDMV